MPLLTAMLLLLLSAIPAMAAPEAGCPNRALGTCITDKTAIKQGRKAFERGLRLRDREKLAEALEEFRRAADLVPDNVEYLTVREVARQQLVYQHLERGNALLADKQQLQALAEFRMALELDPGNEFAVQRARDALSEQAREGLPPTVRVVAQADGVDLAPAPGVHDLQYQGDARGLFEQIASRFGLRVTFDDSFQPRSVRLALAGVDFQTAMAVAAQMTKTFWVPISEKEFLVARDTVENRRALERMALRTFYLGNISTPQQMNELVGLLRGLFDVRLVNPQPTKSLLTVRAPRRTLEAATRVLDGLALGRPQVLLEIHTYEVNRTMLRNLGVDLPRQFRLFNLPTEALGLIGQPGIQDLINQLIASGAINQASTQAIAALLAQAASQGGSVFAQPFAVFGGGITLMGLTIPPASVTAGFNESKVTSLQKVTLRAAQGDAATLRIGSRFPIVNASFAPIFASPDIARVIQNQSFTAPFPSFTYEDLGLILKATPMVHGHSEVTLQLEVAVRSLTGQAVNGVPVLGNREFKTSMTVKNGEAAVLAGNISESEQRSLRGIPGIGHIPGLGLLAATESKEVSENELLVLITPHIVSPGPGEEIEVWLPPAK